MTKTVVITGATSGIGKELVKLFFDDGYTVFAGYRNKDLCIDFGNNVTWVYIDMLKPDSISAFADFVKSKTDKADILINTAGTVVAGAVENIDIKNIREQFEVNTFSHIALTQKLSDILKNGRIVNISSMASFGQFPFISPYCASKRALDIFFNAFALENHKNISVVSVKPGVISTPLWEKAVKINEKVLEKSEGYEKEMNFMKRNALLNSHRGLTAVSAAKKIKKIALKKNPKPSYTIGLDAKFAQILSYFPLEFVNFAVKIGMKLRIK